jgi:hypothetical protein
MFQAALTVTPVNPETPDVRYAQRRASWLAVGQAIGNGKQRTTSVRLSFASCGPLAIREPLGGGGQSLDNSSPLSRASSVLRSPEVRRLVSTFAPALRIYRLPRTHGSCAALRRTRGLLPSMQRGVPPFVVHGGRLAAGDRDARGQAEPALAISRAGAAPRLLAKACEEPRGFASDERRHAVQLADESASARRQRNVSGLRCASAAHLPTNQLPTPASASDWGFHEEPEVAASEPCARCLSRGPVGALGACEAEAAAVCWSGHKGWMGYESGTVRSGGRALGSDVDLRSCVLELDPVARSTVPSGSFPSGAPHVWSRAGVRTLTSHAAGGPTVAPPSATPHHDRDCAPTNG